MKWKRPKPVWWGLISTNSYLSFLIILRKWKGWQRKAVLSPLCTHTYPATQGCSPWLWEVIIPGHPQTILIWFWSRDLKKAFQGRSTEKKDLQPWGMQCLQLREIRVLANVRSSWYDHTLLWVHYFEHVSVQSSEHVSVTLLSLFYLLYSICLSIFRLKVVWVLENTKRKSLQVFPGSPLDVYDSI